MDKWRSDFVEDWKAVIAATDLSIAKKWQKYRLPTTSLPVELQNPWNRELTRRVRERSNLFFASLRGTALNEPFDNVENEVDEVIAKLTDAGDFFPVGELLAIRLEEYGAKHVDRLFPRIVTAWSTARPPLFKPETVEDLVAHLDALPADSVATALVNAVRRLKKSELSIVEAASDVAFRLKEKIASCYDIEARRSPTDTCYVAVAKLDEKISDTLAATNRFLRTTPATAKAASIELLRTSHALQPLLTNFERGLLRDLEILVGAAFRKICEAYERGDDVSVLRRAPELLDNIRRHSPEHGAACNYSGIWRDVLSPVIAHLSTLIKEATSRGAASLAPQIKLRNPSTKADLRTTDREISLSFALSNEGRGHANNISLKREERNAGLILLVEPNGPFDLAPECEQLVRVQVILRAPTALLKIPVTWVCETPAGNEVQFEDEITVTQQVVEPNWDALISDPPYSLNPIRRPDRLYGRDPSIRVLTLAAMAGSSQFVWGQKRIGKTSLLQVLASKLTERDDTVCTILRMGELASLHEGEVGHLIASRLKEKARATIALPAEAEFGAGIGRLVPFIEQLSSASSKKFVVIIDEFDDLDPSFYVGERGRQFVKALRSISEVGLTFFFVGSERMEAIYQRHQADLNKWTNIHLDRIDNRSECRALVINPVADVIEFAQDAADLIVDYCGGNPFYINNFCYQIFERCLQEHRTFVDASDAGAALTQLLRALGPTNFSHFWEDNPILDAAERRDAACENCVALSCVAMLGGTYEEIEELYEVQDSLQLSAAQRATREDIRRACNRLISRNVLRFVQETGKYVIGLPIFREWLSANATSKLLPIWIEYQDSKKTLVSATVKSSASELPSDYSQFIIPEDDLIAVSQRLIFCGRQKDVADIRSWLRQFDDDTRIEIAFMLLKRIAERGFINEGARSLAVAKVEEMIKARRLEIGTKAWKIERGRLDNLCLTYVDSELKSGATTVRELRNMMRPGKSAPAKEIQTWMGLHLKDDPMVVIVDDFAGSGTTLAKGLSHFRSLTDPKIWKAYTKEGRICVVVMFSFPEAVATVRKTCPEVQVFMANALGDELRATSTDAAIFETEADLRFARDMLLQIGRELYPDAPLGFGDLGALVAFHNAVPNNTLPIFWSNGPAKRPWKPIFPRA
jgi:hypothetical protein